MSELDQYVAELKTTFNKGEKRKTNSEYKKIEYQIKVRKEKLKADLSEVEKNSLVQELKELEKRLKKTPYSDPMDSNYRRLVYVRYADDFLIGIIGNKKDAEGMKANLKQFLEDKLGLELSEEKTLITHSNEKARFLGYDVVITRDKAASRDKCGNLKRSYNYRCKLYVPKDKWVGKLLELDVLNIVYEHKWKAKPRSELIRLDDIEILLTYNAEIRGIYEYYKLANNASALNMFYSIMKWSLYKTFISKYRSSMRKIAKKHIRNGIFTVSYQTKKGIKSVTLYNEGFARVKTPVKKASVDEKPSTLKYSSLNSLTSKLLAGQCEWCKKENVKLEMHHIRKLKDLKGKKKWKRVMIARKRKTLALCLECHDDLHAGRLD